MKNKITYFNSKLLLSCFGFYLIFDKIGHNAYIAVILGSLLGIINIYIFDILRKKQKELQKYKTLNFIYKLLMTLFSSFLIVLTLATLELFVNTFYLVNTPKIIIVFSFFLTALYLVYKGNDIIIKLSNILYPVSLLLVIITCFVTIKYLNFSEILPIFNFTNLDLIKSTLIYSALSSIPCILEINFNNNFKDEIKNYLISTICLLFICLATILMLGEELLKMYSFPTYTVLKRVKILNFVENIENFLSFIWYFDFIILLANLLSDLKSTITNKYIYYILCLILPLIAIYTLGINYINFKLIIDYTYLIFYIFLFLIIILLVTLHIKHHKKTK